MTARSRGSELWGVRDLVRCRNVRDVDWWTRDGLDLLGFPGAEGLGRTPVTTRCLGVPHEEKVVTSASVRVQPLGQRVGRVERAVHLKSANLAIKLDLLNHADVTQDVTQIDVHFFERDKPVSLFKLTSVTAYWRASQVKS